MDKVRAKNSPALLFIPWEQVPCRPVGESDASLGVDANDSSVHRFDEGTMQRLGIREHLSEAFSFCAESDRSKSAFSEVKEALGLDGLEQVAEGAESDGVHRALERCLTRDEDDLDAWIELVKFLKEPDPALVGQSHIDDRESRTRPGGGHEGARGVLR